MGLFGKNYDEDFEELKKELSSINGNIEELSEANKGEVTILRMEINEVRKKVDGFGSTLDEIKQLISDMATPAELVTVVNSPIKEVEPDENDWKYDVPMSARRKYRNMVYSQFEFKSPNGIRGKPIGISDILRLKKFIDSDVIYTKQELNKLTIPYAKSNSFARILYNYQIGYFDVFLIKYESSTEFTFKNNKLYINGINTHLSSYDVNEIVSIVTNAKNHYECVDNLIHTYDVEPKFIKIVTDFHKSSKLLNGLNRQKKVQFENNPQKRKEKGFV